MINAKYINAKILYCPSSTLGPTGASPWLGPNAPCGSPCEPSSYAHVWAPDASSGSVPYVPDGTGSPNGPNIVGWVKNLRDLSGTYPEGGRVDPARLSLAAEYHAPAFYPTYNHHGGFSQPTILHILWADGSVSPCNRIYWQSPWGYVPHQAFKR